MLKILILNGCVTSIEATGHLFLVVNIKAYFKVGFIFKILILYLMMLETGKARLHRWLS